MTLYDRTEILHPIWTALHDYRDKCIPDNDDAWDNICTHMAWIKEELELDFDD
jgi:hypothetical protein|tara:strand:- start:567 stop:725 length:159 start_codon:yes stop_codon:yes gene_type:complete